MSVLGYYFYTQSEALPPLFRKWLLLGLLFSIGGDTLLMFVENGPDREHFFLLGLASFLITHLCYLQAFRSYPSQAIGWVRRHPWVLLPFLLFLIGNTAFLWPDLPADKKIPVALYSTAIIAMTIAGVNLAGKIHPLAYQLLLAGILLFVCSDSLIALNKFKSSQLSIPYPRLSIMICYLVGQYLIVLGSLRSRPIQREFN